MACKMNNYMNYNSHPMKTLPSLLLGAACLATLTLTGNAHAVLVDFYISTTARSDGAAALAGYRYNTVTGSASLVATYNQPSGITGSLQDQRSTLSVSGDKKYLAWAGFASGTNAITLFNLTTSSFGTTTYSGLNAYTTAWTPSGSSIYLGGVSAATSPGVITTGGTTPTALRSGNLSLDTIRYNNDHLFYSRNTSNANVGVYRADASGLITSSTTWTQLDGTGWDRAGTNVYAGFDFFGTNTLFVANNETNTIEVYRSANPGLTNNWNQYTTLSLSSLLPGSGDLQQLSLVDLGDNNAQLFFTSGDGTTSTFGTVAWNYDGANWSFGTASLLDSSTTMMFQGVAAVPEPGPFALLAAGAGMLLLRRINRARCRA